jgi:hypothetical protein
VIPGRPKGVTESRNILTKLHAKTPCDSSLAQQEKGRENERHDGPTTRAQKVYKANDPVAARYSRKSLWYAATVVNVRDDGLIKIKWLDGDKVARTVCLAEDSLPHMHQWTLMLQLVKLTS